jgi:hypothetical protein
MAMSWTVVRTAPWEKQMEQVLRELGVKAGDQVEAFVSSLETDPFPQNLEPWGPLDPASWLYIYPLSLTLERPKRRLVLRIGYVVRPSHLTVELVSLTRERAIRVMDVD